jgi:Uma2 family endonuclease
METTIIDPALVVVVAPELGNGSLLRLSVAQYHAMARAGILDEASPVELLEGYLVTKLTKNPAHVLAKRRLRGAIERVLPSGWFPGSEDPFTTSDSEPEPDLAVIRGDPERYAERHPLPDEIALLIEVADSSLRRDQTLKKRIYARAGVPAYWIVNLVDRRIEVYTTPSGPVDVPDYAERVDYGEGEAVPLMLDGQELGRLAVSEVLA